MIITVPALMAIIIKFLPAVMTAHGIGIAISYLNRGENDEIQIKR
jgi:hypothetical protein